MLALAAFVVCALTGIMLVPVYRPEAAFDSIALILLKNPAGVAIRSLHYWSAQIFLVLMLAHIAEHFLKQSELRVRFGIWLRLCLSIVAVFGVMLSGFLLRGDAASAQAMLVLRSLLGLVPAAGELLSRLLTGTGSGLTTVYLHHAATLTILIWLVSIEHARLIMPRARALWIVLPPIVLLSLFLVPGLQWQAEAVEKGPWYLVGLQELLHWMPWPGAAVWLAILGLVLLIVLPKLPPQMRSAVRWTLAGATVAYMGLTIVGVVFRGDGWRFESPTSVWADETHYLSLKAYLPADAGLLAKSVPMIAGKREGCLACHKGMTGFVAAHDPKSVGCASCHLGNPLTLDKALAHAGMTLTPGNLSVIAKTCGASNCHSEVAGRVQISLMNLMSGVVAVDKFVFGESEDIDAHYSVAALHHSAADTHLRQLCASCHLGQEKEQPAVIDETSRGGGCSACHLQYDTTAATELTRRGTSFNPLHHPDISIHVSAQTCFGCHSRSGRIATNYEGWHETQLDETTARSSPDWPAKFRLLADGRVFEKRTADIHFESGMTCVDCHVAAEVMSDGATHTHERDAIKIACIDCHQRGATPALEFGKLDVESQQIIAMRKLNEPGRRFVTLRDGIRAYPNTFLADSGRPVVELSDTGRRVVPKPVAAVCAGAIHQRLDCAACHTVWAPQCVSCHTSFDPKGEAWDFLAGKFVRGAWQESAAHFESDSPALGVLRTDTGRGAIDEKITTFVPGMIISLEGAEKGSSKSQFHRLYAPASPHTISARSRDCKSCHADPASLGYGRGHLKYVIAKDHGEWQFTPMYPASQADGLPQDAWIGFLREPRAQSTTRKDARPFTLQEQRRILLVGACLACHNEKEPRVSAAFADFEHSAAKLSPQCRLPIWANAVLAGR